MVSLPGQVTFRGLACVGAYAAIAVQAVFAGGPVGDIALGAAAVRAVFDGIGHGTAVPAFETVAPFDSALNIGAAADLTELLSG